MNIEQSNAFSAWILEGLFRASWQGGITAIFVWIFCSLFPRLPAIARSWLWRLVFLKIILAFIWVRPIELALLAPIESTARSVQINQPVPISAAEPALSSVRFPSSDLSYRSDSSDDHVAISAAPSVLLTPTAAAIPGSSAPPNLPSNVPFWTTHWKTLLASLWLCGVTAGFMLLFQQFRVARRLRRSATRCTDERVIHPLIPLARAFGLLRLPQICTSTLSTRPMLIGLFRPTLIFPDQLLANASPESLRMMLAHELAHVRRCDLAWTALAAFVRTFLFFHPLVWLARRESLLAQETACDELALQITSSGTARYAEMLVDVVSLPVSRASTLISLGVAENRKLWKGGSAT